MRMPVWQAAFMRHFHPLHLPCARPLLAFSVGPYVRIHDGSPSYSASSSSSSLALSLATEGLQGHKAVVRLVLFSPDGTLLMTACDERMVRLWEVQGWNCVASW